MKRRLKIDFTYFSLKGLRSVGWKSETQNTFEERDFLETNWKLEEKLDKLCNIQYLKKIPGL